MDNILKYIRPGGGGGPSTSSRHVRDSCSSVAAESAQALIFQELQPGTDCNPFLVPPPGGKRNLPHTPAARNAQSVLVRAQHLFSSKRCSCIHSRYSISCCFCLPPDQPGGDGCLRQATKHTAQGGNRRHRHRHRYEGGRGGGEVMGDFSCLEAGDGDTITG